MLIYTSRQTDRLRFGTGHIILLILTLHYSPLIHAGALERLFAPKAELWSFWQISNPAEQTGIVHTSWDRFLHTYVQQDDNGINRLHYARVTKVDYQSLQDYITAQQQIPIRKYNPDEQLAYWINLYNAVTVHVVLQHYPVASIRDINNSPGFFAVGPWGKKLLTVEAQPVSLNDIEHRILRPIWKEPRLHYALNCASLGCPNLSDRAYTASILDDMLELAARTFVNHPRGVRIEDNELIVSSIYSWFQEDFGQSDTAVIQHLRQYASPSLAKQLAAFKHIGDDEYDWRLNDTDPVTPGLSD